MLTSPPASSPDSLRHPHGDIDQEIYYRVRTILGERGSHKNLQYLIDWEDNERTGEKYVPSWEPRENVNKEALADWVQQKAAKANGTRSLIVKLRIPSAVLSAADTPSKPKPGATRASATPSKPAVKRGKARTVVPSSSLSENTPVSKTPARAFAAESSPVEIGESPGAYTAPFIRDEAEESLFIPEENAPVIPSQDLAVVQLSAPPSSYRDYETIPPSQAATASPSEYLQPEQPADASANTGEYIAVAGTGQQLSLTNFNHNQQLSGRVVPDSQSFPTSLHLESQTEEEGTRNPDKTAGETDRQVVSELQAVARAPSAEPTPTQVQGAVVEEDNIS